MITPPADTRPPRPPFTRATAVQKARAAEDAWNSRDPEPVSPADSARGRWRNRAECAAGRAQIVSVLRRTWARAPDDRLIKELLASQGRRTAVRFAYAWHDEAGRRYRSFGHEHRACDAHGLATVRHACVNDRPIRGAARRFHWPLGRRPGGHPGLADLGCQPPGRRGPPTQGPRHTTRRLEEERRYEHRHARHRRRPDRPPERGPG